MKARSPIDFGRDAQRPERNARCRGTRRDEAQRRTAIATRRTSTANAGTSVPSMLATSGMRRITPRSGATDTRPQPAAARLSSSRLGSAPANRSTAGTTTASRIRSIRGSLHAEGRNPQRHPGRRRRSCNREDRGRCRERSRQVRCRSTAATRAPGIARGTPSRLARADDQETTDRVPA